MAIAIVNANRGTGTDFVSGTSFGFSPTANFTAGNYAILVAVCDNVDTDEGVTTDLSITDSKGNTWVKDREQTEANTAAATGVTVAVFHALMSSAVLTSDTVTLTVSSAVVAKGAGLFEVSIGGGNVLSLASANGNNAAAGTSFSVAISGLTSKEYLWVGVPSAEASSSTGQADVAPGDGAGWPATVVCGTSAGAGATDNVIARPRTRISTTTTETFANAGPLTARDRATMLMAYEEVAAGGGTVLDPFGMSGFFGA